MKRVMTAFACIVSITSPLVALQEPCRKALQEMHQELRKCLEAKETLDNAIKTALNNTGKVDPLILQAVQELLAAKAEETCYMRTKVKAQYLASYHHVLNNHETLSVPEELSLPSSTQE